jgi:ADP-heptose:LPS heptosyltransferase
MMSKPELLLIYPDFLGDFILFFPFIAAYAERFERQFSQVTWLCHPSVMGLAQAYRSVWPANLRVVPCEFSMTSLSPKGLMQWPWRKQQALRFLQQHQLPVTVDEVWCPSFMPWLANGVLKAVKSPRKVSRPVQNKLYNRLQHWLNTDIVQLQHFDQFVVYQHHAFFQQAFGQALPLPPRLSPPISRPVPFKKRYIAIVPDSAATCKEWPAQHFATLVKLVLSQSDYDVVLLGVRETTRQALNTLLLPNDRVHTLMGQTSPAAMLAWVESATAVVCNDSFALHAAVLMEKPVICLTNGSYRGRYWPYPDNFVNTSNHYYILTPSTVTDMASIPVDAVWHRLAPMLGSHVMAPSVLV